MLVSVQIILLLILLCLSAFFSGSETALFSLSAVHQEKIKRRSSREGRILQELLDQPRTLIITVLIGNEFVNIAFSALCAGLIIKLSQVPVPWINLVVVLPLLLLFGEITPKVLAVTKSETFATFVARPLYLFMRLITPLRWLIRNVADRILNLFIKEERKSEVILNEDLIRTIVGEGEKEGILEAIEREYIYRVFDFGDMKAEDVMTPRALLFSLDIRTPILEIITKIKKYQYSKIPIYDREPDNIVGILFATDLLGLDSHQLKDLKDLASLLRKPYFIPPSKRIDDLFTIFQRQKISIAIVVDEYGIIQGIITMEDLLEQIFGDIRDGHQVASKNYEVLGENLFRVKATLELSAFNELLGADLHSDEVDTIGGYIFAQFGELPQPRATIIIENMQFTIETIAHNRIESILVKRMP